MHKVLHFRMLTTASFVYGALFMILQTLFIEGKYLTKHLICPYDHQADNNPLTYNTIDLQSGKYKLDILWEY